MQRTRILAGIGGVLVLVGCGTSNDVDAALTDAGTTDVASDAAPTDAALTDAGPTDAASTDATDATSTDAGHSCDPPPAFDEGVEYERTIHVANGGDDDASGSEATPLATLDEALVRVTPGTRVVVHEGTYTPMARSIMAVGEPGRPIAFVASGEVIIDSTGRPNAFRLVQARYIVLDGFTVIGRPLAPLNIDDGGELDTPTEYVVVRNFTIDGAGRYCIKLAGVDHFWILNNDVSDCGSDNGIDVVGGHDGVIAWNDVHDMPGPGAVSGIQIKMGSADVLIVGNTIRNVYDRSLNMGGAGIQALYRPPSSPHEAIRLTAVGNLIEPAVGRGIGMAFAGCVDCVFANNTIIRPSTWVARVLPGGADRMPLNGRFVNNLIVLNVDSLASEIALNVGPVDASTFEFDNNLWYALDRPADWAGPDLASLSPGPGSIIQQDPQLADLASGDYHLTRSSPAIGAGQSIGVDLPDHDRRCFLNPQSIGAFRAP